MVTHRATADQSNGMAATFALDNHPFENPILEVMQFQDRILVRSKSGLWELKGDELHPIKFTRGIDPLKWDTAHSSDDSPFVDPASKPTKVESMAAAILSDLSGQTWLSSLTMLRENRDVAKYAGILRDARTAVFHIPYLDGCSDA